MVCKQVIGKDIIQGFELIINLLEEGLRKDELIIETPAGRMVVTEEKIQTLKELIKDIREDSSNVFVQVCTNWRRDVNKQFYKYELKEKGRD